VPVSPIITTLISDEESLIAAIIRCLKKLQIVLNVIYSSINHSKVESVFCISFFSIHTGELHEIEKKSLANP
jgi:hypothetical protein